MIQNVQNVVDISNIVAAKSLRETFYKPQIGDLVSGVDQKTNRQFEGTVFCILHGALHGHPDHIILQTNHARVLLNCAKVRFSPLIKIGKA